MKKNSFLPLLFTVLFFVTFMLLSCFPKGKTARYKKQKFPSKSEIIRHAEQSIRLSLSKTEETLAEVQSKL